MDRVVAKVLEAELVGKAVGNWTVERLIDHGKSAAVFVASRDADRAALKIFDRSLVERFGKNVQLTRIQRELSLLGLRHPNLVQILGGGEDPEHDVLFVVMEFVEDAVLSKMLAQVPRAQIWPLIGQLASAARFLEDLSLSHRDIKPQNIAISSDCRRLILMDLGVLKPFPPGDARAITDAEQRPFVGTLQYGPPELLMREEKNDRDGWRAVTFYQIGAVLHDLLVKQPLFAEYVEPYPRLVEAVKTHKPQIIAPDVPADLVVLARNCLMKAPAHRLQYVNWESFQPKPDDASLTALTERIRKRTAANHEGRRVGSEERDQLSARALQRVLKDIQDVIRQQCISTGVFPPVTVRSSQSSPRRAEIEVRFGRSRSVLLETNLVFRFTVEINDADNAAVTIGSVAFATPKGRKGEPDAVKEPLATLFAGTFDEDAFGQRVKKMMLEALDAAQTLEPSDSFTILFGLVGES